MKKGRGRGVEGGEGVRRKKKGKKKKKDKLLPLFIFFSLF